MSSDFAQKSSVEEIRARFDADVERFSNLETGQSATVDAPLTLELVTQAARALVPQAHSVLDIGCGAGNYTLKLLQELPGLDVTLLDLSLPMLQRAAERVQPATSGQVAIHQGDIRSYQPGEEKFDLILASAVFHHLREEAEWEGVFSLCYRALRPGGVLFINDLVEQSHPAVQALIWQRYGTYLSGLKNETYRDHVFGYIAKEDTPRSLLFQLDMLRKVGFSQVDILHKNVCFAAFYGQR